jgi:hypothetical protein
MMKGNTIYFKSVEGWEWEIIGENGQKFIPQFSIQIDAGETPTITHSRSKYDEEIAYLSTPRWYVRIGFIRSFPLVNWTVASLSNPVPLQEFPKWTNQTEFLKNLWTQDGGRRRAVLKFAREIAKVLQ